MCLVCPVSGDLACCAIAARYTRIRHRIGGQYTRLSLSGIECPRGTRVRVPVAEVFFLFSFHHPRPLPPLAEWFSPLPLLSFSSFCALQKPCFACLFMHAHTGSVYFKRYKVFPPTLALFLTTKCEAKQINNDRNTSNARSCPVKLMSLAPCCCWKPKLCQCGCVRYFFNLCLKIICLNSAEICKYFKHVMGIISRVLYILGYELQMKSCPHSRQPRRRVAAEGDWLRDHLSSTASHQQIHLLSLDSTTSPKVSACFTVTSTSMRSRH